jgi:hypothetical protein
VGEGVVVVRYEVDFELEVGAGLEIGIELEVVLEFDSEPALALGTQSGSAFDADIVDVGLVDDYYRNFDLDLHLVRNDPDRDELDYRNLVDRCSQVELELALDPVDMGVGSQKAWEEGKSLDRKRYLHPLE